MARNSRSQLPAGVAEFSIAASPQARKRLPKARCVSDAIHKSVCGGHTWWKPLVESGGSCLRHGIAKFREQGPFASPTFDQLVSDHQQGRVRAAQPHHGQLQAVP